MSQRLKGKIALVTGASRGIGAAIAKKYISEGAHVIIAARTVSGLEKIDDYAQSLNSKTTIVPIDLSEFSKIEQLAYHLQQRFGYIDILVGNAAILGGLSPIGHFKAEIWEKVMNINANANWHLIKNFDSLLKNSTAGRAIFVTSGITKCNSAYWGAYAASKAALEMIAKTYAKECETSKVKVNLIDPGVVATRLRAEAMPGEDSSTLPCPDDVTEIFVALASNYCKSNGEIIRCY